MHTETPWDLRNIIEKGEIPQVAETYSYLNVGYPCLNEKQLAIGETTIHGKKELINDNGLFMIEELQRIALERCTNSRDAIRLMGGLAEKYGFADRGECLTIADKNEVWQFEIFGAGLTYKSAVWAAVRIPDDQVGISANLSRIGKLDLKNPDYYMASKNVISLAQELGYYDAKYNEPFIFWKAYSEMPKAFSTREYYILSTLAPSLKLSIDVDELPFSVKPDKKVGVRDIIKYYRETYEGTEFDMTKNLVVNASGASGQTSVEVNSSQVKSLVANPWMSDDMMNLLNTLKPGTVEEFIPIAKTRCSYSQIIQCRDWLPDEIGGVAFFSFDNPAESPRIPIYAGTLSLPANFEICGQKRYREDAAIWQFRRTNRLAEIKWGVTRKYIEEAIKRYEDKAFAELPMIDKMALELYDSEKGKEPQSDEKGNLKPGKYREFITKYSNDFARSAMSEWWEMGDNFFTMFATGF
jgi:dipeptidase